MTDDCVRPTKATITLEEDTGGLTFKVQIEPRDFTTEDESGEIPLLLLITARLFEYLQKLSDMSEEGPDKGFTGMRKIPD